MINPGEFITTVTLLIAMAAVLISLEQNLIQSRAMKAQAFLTLLSLDSDEEIDSAIRTLRVLDDAKYLRIARSEGELAAYDVFRQDEGEKTQRAIYDLVVFLNVVAGLVYERRLPRQTAWDFYFRAYRLAYEKLHTWWLTGQRNATYDDRFQNFADMGRVICAVTGKQVKRFTARQSLRRRLLGFVWRAGRSLHPWPF